MDKKVCPIQEEVDSIASYIEAVTELQTEPFFSRDEPRSIAGSGDKFTYRLGDRFHFRSALITFRRMGAGSPENFDHVCNLMWKYTPPPPNYFLTAIRKTIGVSQQFLTEAGSKRWQGKREPSKKVRNSEKQIGGWKNEVGGWAAPTLLERGRERPRSKKKKQIPWRSLVGCFCGATRVCLTAGRQDYRTTGQRDNSIAETTIFGLRSEFVSVALMLRLPFYFSHLIFFNSFSTTLNSGSPVMSSAFLVFANAAAKQSA
jgi:hypothetical protein